MLHGPDVSQFNPPKLIPWHTAQFAFVRVTSGLTLDTLADEHFRRASYGGVVLLGAYHYLKASSPGEAQARAFLQRVHDLEEAEHLGPLALAVDIEDPLNGPPWDRVAYTAAFAAFVGWLHENSSRPCAIYTSPAFMASGMGTTPIIRASPLWVSHWTSAAKPTLPASWDRWAIWQYAVKEISPGVKLDHNVFDGDHAAWRRTFHPTADDYAHLGPVVTATQRASGRGPDGSFVTFVDGLPVEPSEA